MSIYRSQSQERWLAFFNQVIYASLAPVYDSLNVMTFGAWWQLVSRALVYVPQGGSVLEVGFGPGRLHVELVRRADLCAGLDLAKGMCTFTRRRVLREGLPAWITRGNVFELPYASRQFDTVVSTFAFSGFPDGQRAIDEMVRVVVDEGQMVLVDIGLPEDGNRTGTVLARLWERMGDYLYDIPAMMEMAGLRVETFTEFGPGSHIRAVVGRKVRGL